MMTEISNLITRLNDPALLENSVMTWGAPVPCFGNINIARIATVGINPSNLEFVGNNGQELEGPSRRFHTLNSLNLVDWNRANENHKHKILESCYEYFNRNPYDAWFKKLDYVISGTSYSYYFPSGQACHLDLIPYATSTKWAHLNSNQQKELLKLTGDTLGILLRESPVEILVLNGSTVIDNLIKISNVKLEKRKMPSWSLPRRTGKNVTGYAYCGTVSEFGKIKLRRPVAVLAYNHNLQSSYGVTSEVYLAIRKWITRKSQDILL